MASNIDPGQSALIAGRFQKIKLLGVGLVGEVYRARDTQDASDVDGEVALKILRTGQAASLIKNEALILGQLWREEETLKDGIHSIPRLITADDLDQQPFLAMEFIRGKQVSQVLRESESGYLEEAVALNIGAQLFRVLHILHEKINKTYSDLKIENLWWLPADERLKITDWNVLQDRKASFPGKTDPLLQDLFRASVSLYWMLTGELPDFQNELNAERLQHASNWGQISDGVKDLLNKMLREESLKKMGTAYQIKVELDRLLRYWKDDVKALKDRAKGKSGDRLDAFSILSRRISQPDEEFLQIEREIQESLKQRNDLTRSVALFGAGSYGAAKTLTDEAYPHASEPHTFLWWKQVIDLVEKIESLMKKSGRGDKVNHVRDAALKSINAYQTHDYKAAEGYFGEIEIFVSDDEDIHKAYSELLAVLKVQKFCASGQEKREQIQFAEEKEYKSIYDDAWKDYVEAFSNAGKISIAPLLPDLLSPVYLKNMVAAVKNESNVLSMVKKANSSFQNTEIESASKFWREGFKLDIDHPKLVDSVVKAAQENLDMQNITLGKLELAEELLRIIPSVVSNYSLACNSLRKQIQAARLFLSDQTTTINEKIHVSQKTQSVDLKIDDSSAEAKISTYVADVQVVKSPEKKARAKPKQEKVVEHVDKVIDVKPTKVQKESNVKTGTDKKLLSVESKKDNSGSYADRDEDLKKADDLISKINSRDYQDKMTIDIMLEDVGKLKSLVQGKTQIPYWEINCDWYTKYATKLKKAQSLWQELSKLPIGEWKENIGELENLGFHGKTSDFEQELCIKEIQIFIQNKDLTIDFLSEKLKEMKGNLIKNEPQKEIKLFEDDLIQANTLFQQAIDSPLEKREGFIKDIKRIGFYGKKHKDDFESHLYIDILRRVVAARSKDARGHYDDICMIDEPQNDEQVKNFLRTEKEYAKNRIIADVKKDLETKSPAISKKLEILWVLKADWPIDETISNLIGDINKSIMNTPPKFPDDEWEDIDYYYYLAHLDPKAWQDWYDAKGRSRLDKWGEYPHVQAKYGEKIFAMKSIVRKISEIRDENNPTLQLKSELSGVYKTFNFSQGYSFRLVGIIKNYALEKKLGWTIDKCMSWFEQLHELEKKRKG